MVVESQKKVGFLLAINGIYGNLGVAAAALVTGYLIDRFNWQMAFVLPGVVSLLTGVAYLLFNATAADERKPGQSDRKVSAQHSIDHRYPDKQMLIRIFSIILIISVIGGLIFQSTTFALPKIFEERLSGIVESASELGSYTFLVFFVASFAQLIVGYLIDKFSVRLIFSIILLLQTLSLFVMQHLSGIAVMFISVILMVSVFGQIPIVDTVVARVTRPEWRSRAYALRNVCSFIAAPLSVSLIAYIHLNWGFSALFLSLSIVACIAFISIFLIPKLGLHSSPASTGTKLEEI